jgi:hypothetical protein
MSRYASAMELGPLREEQPVRSFLAARKRARQDSNLRPGFGRFCELTSRL